MSYDLILQNFVLTEPHLQTRDIATCEIKIKQSGERVGIVTTTYGTTFIKRITPDGLDITSIIKLPFFQSIEERNKFIMKHFYGKYTQSDIAIFFNMSQSQISNIIRQSQEV